MSFKPLSLSIAFRNPQVRRVLYGTNQPRTPAQGFELLAKISLDIPVHLIRIDERRHVYLLRKVPGQEIAPCRLVPGLTAYAVAFQADGVSTVVVVATGAVPDLEGERVVNDLRRMIPPRRGATSR